jgi:hypothetical protein
VLAIFNFAMAPDVSELGREGIMWGRNDSVWRGTQSQDAASSRGAWLRCHRILYGAGCSQDSLDTCLSRLSCLSRLTEIET